MGEMFDITGQKINDIDINWEYHVSRGFIFASFLLMLFPIYKMLTHMLIVAHCKKEDSNSHTQPLTKKVTNPDKPHFIQSKIILSLSIILYVSYITFCSFDALAKYISFDFFTPKFCKIEFVITGWLYITGKALLYNYFILRANDTFWNTSYQYSQCLVQSILPFELIIIFCIMFPPTYVFYHNVTYSIKPTHINGGSICVLSFTGNTFIYQQIIFSLGGVVDIIFGALAVAFLLIKLFIIIQQQSINNEWIPRSQVKNRNSKFAVDDSLLLEVDNSNKQVIYQSNTNNLIVNNSNNKKQCVNVDNKQNEDEFDSLLPIEITNAKVINNIAQTSKQLNEQSVSNTLNISPSVIHQFHVNTQSNNRILLLITKLLTLLIFETMFMLIASGIYLVTKDIWTGYVIDSCVDIYCLFLTFRFSEYYYYSIFGGTKCTRVFFPSVKTISLAYKCRCCECYNEHSDSVDFVYSNDNSGTAGTGLGFELDTELFQQCCVCVYYCLCCKNWRRLCCMKCYRMNWKKQKRIHTLANKEIGLILATSLQYKPRQDNDVWNPAGQ